MQRLDVPVPPPIFEEALGYDGQATWLGIYWTAMGDEVMITDGRTAFTGNWQPYLAYRNHKNIYAVLGRHDLGSSDNEATEWLLLDRTSRTFFVASIAEAEEQLKNQWPSEPPAPPLTEAERHTLYDAFQKAVERYNTEFKAEDIEQQIKQNHERYEAFLTWLNTLG
jgi:hypothetical protein